MDFAREPRPGHGTRLLYSSPDERWYLTARGMLVIARRREDGSVFKAQVSILG